MPPSNLALVQPTECDRLAASQMTPACAAPRFVNTVDVLEVVAESVGFCDPATLCALRAVSTRCADAVSAAVRRVCTPEGAVNPWGADEVAPTVARIPMASRLCVVAAGGDWLRVIPASVLRATDGRRLAADVARVLGYIPRPRSLVFANNGRAVTRAVMSAVADAPHAAASLEELTITHVSMLSAAAVSRIAEMPNLRALTIAHTSYSRVDDEALEPVLRALGKLEVLDLSANDAITDASLAVIAETAPGLRSLRLARSGRRITNAGVVAVAARCPELEELDLRFGQARISDVSIVAVAQGCPKLRALDVSWCSVTDRAIYILAQECNRRREESVAGSEPSSPVSAVSSPLLLRSPGNGSFTSAASCAVTSVNGSFALGVADTNGSVSGDSLVALAEAYGGLCALDVTGTMGAVSDEHVEVIAQRSAESFACFKAARDTRLTDAAIQAVAAHCPNLVTLDVGFSSGRITDDAITSVAEKCPKMRELNVSHTSGMASDRGIIAVANHCKELEALSSSVAFGDVTDKGLRAIAKNCPRLVSLDVSHTHGKVSDGTIQAIADNCPRFAYLGCSGVRQHLSGGALSNLAASCPAYGSSNEGKRTSTA